MNETASILQVYTFWLNTPPTWWYTYASLSKPNPIFFVIVDIYVHIYKACCIVHNI